MSKVNRTVFEASRLAKVMDCDRPDFIGIWDESHCLFWIYRYDSTLPERRKGVFLR